MRKKLSFYEGVREEIDHRPKQDKLIIMGDWDTKVGTKAESNVVGRFELGSQNETGKQLRIL